MRNSRKWLAAGWMGIVLVLTACGGSSDAALSTSQEGAAQMESSAAESKQDETAERKQDAAEAEKHTAQEQTDPAQDGIYRGGSSQKTDTTSQYKTSYRGIVGEDLDVVYLGKPRSLKVDDPSDFLWETTDEKVATVQDGVVTGWKEGQVTITQRRGEEIVQEWQLAVTTFNDGRQAELSFELGRDKIAEIMCSEGGVHEPAFWQQRINTLQDVVNYFQVSGFRLNYDLPILATVDSEWLWSIPGDMILIENSGAASDMIDAALYLLQDDFEDQGFLLNFGYGGGVGAWYYEDGYYYYLDYAQMLMDFWDGKREETYEIRRWDSLEAFTEDYLRSVKQDDTMVVLMVSSQGHDFQPPAYMSYIHDASEIYYKHVTIGLEDEVMKGAKILYSNPDFDYELISVPTEEVPEGLPRYGSKTSNDYPYE